MNHFYSLSPALWLFLLLVGNSLLVNGQNTRYVSTTGIAAPGSATSWASSTTDIQGAINSVSATGGQVWVAAGVYKPGGNGNTDRTLSFIMKNGVAIYGGFAGGEGSVAARPRIGPVSRQPSSTTLSGDLNDNGWDNSDTYHIINNATGLTPTAILDGFVVSGANANGDPDFAYNQGGGVYNRGGDNGFCNPTFRNCTFQRNFVTEWGAAMYNNGGLGGNSSPIVMNCAFLNNSASRSGAIFNNGQVGKSSPVVNNCLFQGNSATNEGGAVLNYGHNGGEASPVLTNCVFADNTANEGGAIYTYANNGTSRPALTNVTFSQNSATIGGAIADNGSGVSLTLTNGVVFGNGLGNTFQNSSSLIVLYSLLENGISTSTYTNGGNNIATATSPFISFTTLQLRAGAEAIEAGNSSAYMGAAIDLAGNPRLVGCRIDMGAFESPYSNAPTPTIFTNPTPDGLVAQVSGGMQYEYLKVIDRVNGYEIRQSEINATGYFIITQSGPYTITVIDANGCRATVTAVN